MGRETMNVRLDLAPLDGLTKAVYRVVWMRRFGGVDRCFIPFFSPTPQHILTHRDQRELDPANNGGLTLVPQIMTRRAEDFLWAAEKAGELGYHEVNLNLGCPSGTVTAKGKGSGFLADPDELDRFFAEVFSRVQQPVSVKTRLGIRDTAEFPRLMEVFNRYPICCLTIHPRLREEHYKGRVHLDAFAAALETSPLPLCYNGDLVTVEDVQAIEERFPTVEALMLGRGAIADPALPRKLRGGHAATREELRAFTEELYASYQDFYGQVEPSAQRMKEVWFYLIHLFQGGEKLSRQLRRSRTPGDYERIEMEIFSTLPLLDHAEGEFI